jgi:hypothetical protein
MSRRYLACIAGVAVALSTAPVLAQTETTTDAGTSGTMGESSDTTPSTGTSRPQNTTTGSESRTDGTSGTSATTSSSSSSTATGTTGASPQQIQVQVQHTPPPAEEQGSLLERKGTDLSVGWRLWGMHVPEFIVRAFVHIEPGWSGSLGVATGPEFVYRNDGIEIVLSAMYVDYSAPAAFMRGKDDVDADMERIQSTLWGAYFTVHFLRGIRFAPFLELQIGAGVGVGYIGGSLFRSQAYRVGDEWYDCLMPGGPGGGFAGCGTENTHYSGNAGGPYTEPGIFNGGYVPTVIPWVSLPHLALHFRPIHNLDLRVEGGYALIGFYGGAAVHFIF